MPWKAQAIAIEQAGSKKLDFRRPKQENIKDRCPTKRGVSKFSSNIFFIYNIENLSKFRAQIYKICALVMLFLGIVFRIFYVKAYERLFQGILLWFNFVVM